jgi:hypothetical protein
VVDIIVVKCYSGLGLFGEKKALFLAIVTENIEKGHVGEEL